jgi:hypothetical protein
MTLLSDNFDIPEDAAKPVEIVIPYVPRAHFKPVHNSKKRFKFVVAHRRAGKSVSQINEIIKRALQNTRTYPPPRYGYVGPSFAQTKDLIWGYAKHYTAGIPGVKISEGDLQLTLPNGAMINLYGGAAAYERMRGLYFDGIVLDEYPLLNPAVLSTVVRPCLADYRGWAIISGTSNGDDHFHDLKKRYEKEIAKMGEAATCGVYIIPVTDTDALHPDEVLEMTKDMTPEEYAREMLCSFDAPVEGSYYGDIINDLTLMTPPRITNVPYDPASAVFTWWDLGIDDAMAIWYFQRVGAEMHIIRYEQFVGKGLPECIAIAKTHGYSFGGHVFPHDIKARELGTGRSRYEIVCELLDNVIVAPMHKVEDGIAAVKSVLPMCWFDKANTTEGLSALKNYHRTKTGRPDHNWASHGSDAFRVGAIALNQLMAFTSSGNIVAMGKALRRRIRGIR